GARGLYRRSGSYTPAPKTVLSIPDRPQPPTPTLPHNGGGRIENSSVLEVALAGEDHGDAGGIGGRNCLAVLHRSPRLDDRPHTGARRNLDAVRIRKEAVAGQHR